MTWLRLRMQSRRRAFRLRGLRRVRFVPHLFAIVLLMMIGQQMALAAHGCQLSSGVTESMRAMASVPGMAGSMHETCPQMQDFSDRWLCAKHCAPDTTLQHDTRSASVPPALFGLLPPFPLDVAFFSLTRAAHEWRYRLRAPPPPATVLFCSLLI